jgi:2-dehydro-3-deoxyglucarate aldolase/4-hydroxy-2-oxoheptanedioate aldolase
LKHHPIKQTVLEGQTVVGAMTFEFFSPGMSAILAHTGCRFVFYDMEHTGLGFETLKWLFSTCRGLPIEPMVRVPRGEYTWLARALVQACRYPPVGRRGAAFGFAQCDYQGGDIGQKIRDYHDRTLVVAQIETERGLAAVEEIAAVDGIDVLWVGHFDLSNFMGIPAQFDNPIFLQAMQHVADVARRHGKAAGFMATDPAWVDRVKAMGYTMLAVGTDVSLLADATRRLVDHAAAPAVKEA